MSKKNVWLPAWAWRLVWRHFRGRQARPAVRWMNRFAFLGLFVGVFAWTSVVAIMNGLQGDIKKRILDQKAHLLWEGTPQEGLADKERLLRERLGPELKKASFILQTEGLLEIPSAEQKGRVSGSGVIIQGLEEVEDNEAGSELVALTRLDIDRPIRLYSAWRLELPPLELKIDRLFQTGIYEIDRSSLRLPRARLEKWLGLNHAVSRIEVQLQDPQRALPWKEPLSELLGVKFKPWQETEAALWYSLRLEKWVLSIAIFFVVLIATLAVHLALSVRIADKAREIGLLRGLGVDDKYLLRLYLTEGLLLGVLGAFFGLWGGFAFCRLISQYYHLPDIYYFTAVPVAWSWTTSMLLALSAVILAGMASWLPAERVKKMEPVEALRS